MDHVIVIQGFKPVSSFLVICEEMIISISSSLINVSSDFAKRSIREIFTSLVVFADEIFLLRFSQSLQ